MHAMDSTTCIRCAERPAPAVGLRRLRRPLVLFAALWIFLSVFPVTIIAQKVEKIIEVSPVWAGLRVGFELKTYGEFQYVGFYDPDRQMTIGQRRFGEDRFRFTRLPEWIGWDSHNYITFMKDDDGHLHVTGNLHNDPLIYFRSERPNDIESFQRIEKMIGRDENRMTYPRFFRGPNNKLIFTYREGGSGDGEQIYNEYDHATQTWSRLLDQPLLSGEGRMNAYPRGPKAGPDGYFHLVWIWRDTPDAATNHNPSYARSRDLIHWETSRGEPIELPIVIATGDVVDPVPARGGAINGNVRLGFDSGNRPIVSYIKYDEEGNTQIYHARSEGGEWVRYQATDWNYRWDFGGGGSIPFEVRVGPVRIDGEGRLTQSYSHSQYGSGAWELDEKTLRPIRTMEQRSERPAGLGRPESGPGMTVLWHRDTGEVPEAEVRYWLRWETLPVNRDRRPETEIPDPTPLRLYKVRVQ